MSSGEADYISATVTCMRASYSSMLMYDLKILCSESYNRDNMNYESAKIIIDNSAALSMAKCD